MSEYRKKDADVELARELLGLADEPEHKYKPRKREFIHIGINRKYLGMTQKERDAAKKRKTS